MAQDTVALSAVASGLEALMTQRRSLLLEGFEALKVCHPSLAAMLLAQHGSQEKAAHWMCQRHRALDQQSGWAALAEGDHQGIWDLLLREPPR